MLAAALLAGCAGLPLTQEEIEDTLLQPVDRVDLDRYMGRWYMIANIPYFAERGNQAVHVEYSRGEDGVIHDLFTARRGFDREPFTRNGLIRITDPVTAAQGTITFPPFLSQDFTILYLDQDYRYTAIGHPSRNFCWVFARVPYMSDEVYEEILTVLTRNLFDVSRVLKIPQTPEQVEQPGFQ